ncbi:MAG: tRNA (adenosine(37)-N6)-threonylcarbamoyltransferase complex dimerization subunit type 1 TsaB [Spirochaetales bacterium]|jgi:tRNA threonylcarbamoyladenosine biosynthesis protein TsaB|nr:tRNA (adenosine(37)-N6)-threonylcarbamoyltransferase complex dimerization subunit type 1 TsaB [Spirochaetales bacterium]
MNILCLDTSTEILRVGLSAPDRWTEQLYSGGLRHGEKLFELLEDGLKHFSLNPGELNLIAAVRGPGSFTGLRIGLSAAKGLSEGWGIPWVGLSSLAIIGNLYSYWPGPVMAVIDGRKNRFYCAAYRHGRAINDEEDSPAEVLAETGRSWSLNKETGLFAGPGAEALGQVFLKEGLAAPVGEKTCALFFKDGGRAVFDPASKVSYCPVMARLGEEHFLSRGGEEPGAGAVYRRSHEGLALQDQPCKTQP